MSEHFYFRTIWEHVTAFSELFNNMSVYVYDKDKYSTTYGRPIGRKIVPIVLAPKEKVMSVLNVLMGSEKPEVDNALPKMSISWSGLSYDADRQRGRNQKRDLFVEYTTTEEINLRQDPTSVTAPEDNHDVRVKHYDIQTVPWNLEFELVIWAKYMDDGVQILEQILPFFSPDRQISISERGIGIEREAKVKLNSVANNFAYDLNEPDRRIVQWTLSFTCECNLYKPIYFEKEILQAVIRVGTVDPRFGHGDSIIISADGANVEGMAVNVISRVQQFDQLTSSTAAISGNLHYITIDTWANPQAIFTPLSELGNNFYGSATEEDDLVISEDSNDFLVNENSSATTNPEAGILTIVLPTFNDESNHPDTFNWPISRHLSFEYYNALNPADPVTPDPDADVEYQDWKDNGSPGGG